MKTTEFRIRDAQPADTASVIALWHACGLTRPWNDPTRDIERAESENSTRLFVGVLDQAVMSTAMVGYDGHRGWLYYLAVADDYRGQGYAAQLITRAENHLIALGCPKLMMLVRPGQPELEAYYARRGYIDNEIRCLGKRLIPDDPSHSR